MPIRAIMAKTIKNVTNPLRSVVTLTSLGAELAFTCFEQNLLRAKRTFLGFHDCLPPFADHLGYGKTRVTRIDNHTADSNSGSDSIFLVPVDVILNDSQTVDSGE